MANLKEKVLLVDCIITSWTALHTSPEIKEAGSEKFECSDLFVIGKLYLINPTGIRLVTSAASKVRRFITTYALRFGNSYILPISLYEPFMDEWRVVRKNFYDAVQEFVRQYPRLINDAKQSMGNLFNESLYPSQAELAERFSVSLDIMDFPSDPLQWHKHLNPAHAQELGAIFEDTLSRKLECMIEDAASRVYTVLEKMINTLSVEDKIFRNSLITNIQECLDMLKHWNVTDNAIINGIAQRVQVILDNVPIEDLREVPEIRKTVVQETAKIAKDIADTFKF